MNKTSGVFQKNITLKNLQTMKEYVPGPVSLAMEPLTTKIPAPIEAAMPSKIRSIMPNCLLSSPLRKKMTLRSLQIEEKIGWWIPARVTWWCAIASIADQHVQRFATMRKRMAEYALWPWIQIYLNQNWRGMGGGREKQWDPLFPLWGLLPNPSSVF